MNGKSNNPSKWVDLLCQTMSFDMLDHINIFMLNTTCVQDKRKGPGLELYLKGILD